VRRILMLALSLSLSLGLTAASRLFAQDEKQKDAPKTDAPKEEPKKDAPKAETAKEDAKKDATPQPDATKTDAKKGAPTSDTSKAAAATTVEEPLPTIPPEVEAKLEAARHAVAEAIVAAQDAGLVETSIDPPPIFDILVTGRALDKRQLKKAVDKGDLQVGVSPEVFGAWFTGYGKMDGVAQKNVRIIQPAKGLTKLYDDRAKMLNTHIEAIRKAKGDAPKTESPKTEELKKEEPKAEAPKPKDEAKPESPKTETSKEEPK